MAAAALTAQASGYTFVRSYKVFSSFFALAGVPQEDGTVRTVFLKEVGNFHEALEDALAGSRREARIAAYIGRMGASDVAVTPSAFSVRTLGWRTELWMEMPLCSKSLTMLFNESGTSLAPLQRHVLCSDVATAVARLHQLGVVHCDVKQDNIVLDPNGVAKLIDFDVSFDAWDVCGYAEECTTEPMATATVRPPEWDPTCTRHTFSPHTAAAGDVFSAGITALSTLLLDCPLNQAHAREQQAGRSTSAAMFCFRRSLLRSLLHRECKSLGASTCTTACQGILASALHMNASRRPSAKDLADALLQGAHGTRVAQAARADLQRLARASAFLIPQSSAVKDEDVSCWERVPAPWGDQGQGAPSTHQVTLRNPQALQHAAEELNAWATALAAEVGNTADALVASSWRRGARMQCMAIAAVQLHSSFTECRKYMQLCYKEEFGEGEVPTFVLVQCIRAGAWTGLSGQADNVIGLVLASARGNASALPLHVQWRTLALFATVEGVQQCLLHPQACAEAVLVETVPKMFAVMMRSGVRALQKGKAAAVSQALQCARVAHAADATVDSPSWCSET